VEVRIPDCRICGCVDLEEVLSLGDIPPVNSFLPNAAAIATERAYPLTIAFCHACSHVQLTHMIDPREIFTDYIYFSSMSETVVHWGRELARRYAAELSLTQSDLVAELASNDGCILKPFGSLARIYGVEPAENIATVAIHDGVPTHSEFFTAELGRTLRRELGPARLIIARNVVAHVPAIVDFITGAAHWLKDDGIFHVEVPYVRDMVDSLEFDTIYHEHLSYLSVTALDRLFRKAGLVLWDVERIPLHGGSLVARGRKGAEATPAVRALLREESEAGITSIERYRRFARETQELRRTLHSFVVDLRQGGRRVAAYGAAAKGVVLTNYCGIGKDLLDFVADRSQYKQGKLMPGTHLPVVPAGEVVRVQPDYLLVLAWNFFDEIARQLDAYHRAGGKFVVPVPQPRIR
jgi:hypothetical protein